MYVRVTRFMRFATGLLVVVSLLGGVYALPALADKSGMATDVKTGNGPLSPEKKLPEALLRKMKKGAKSPYDQPDEAMRFYLDQRTGGSPIDYAAMAEAERKIAKMPRAMFGPGGIQIYDPNNPMGAFIEKVAGDLSNWTELGPGNVGGRTRALLVDPGNSNTMYAGGVAGGVWKTTDGGLNWTPLDDLMDNLAVTSMVFQQQGSGSVNTAVIYAGTGEGVFNLDAVRGAGIFKSTDSGVTWTQLTATNNSNFYYVNKIVASPNNSQVLYAATRTGIWKTADGGASWTRVLNDNGGNTATETVVNTGVGFTDVEIRTDLATDTLIASNGSFTTDGVYRSLDAGATWARVHTATGLGRSDLAIAPSDQQYMYALSADRSNSNRLLNVYRSTDGGATWVARIAGTFDQTNADWLLLTNPIIANMSPCGFGSNSLLNQGWYDNIIAVAPHDRNVLYSGGIDLFRSDDGGATWGIISYWWVAGSTGYVHADQHAIAFDPGWDGSTNQTLFVGNDGGVYASNNAMGTVATGGTGGDGICYNGSTLPSVTFTPLNNGYGVTQFYHGRPYPSPTTTYFGGTQDNGTIRGTDGGGLNNWTEIHGGDGGYVSFDPANTSTLFAETTYNDLNRSTNGGGSFTAIFDNGDETSSHFLFIAPFRHDPGNAERIWYGGWYPYRSTNAVTGSTVTWVQAGTLSSGSGSISAWAIDPNDSDRVYYGLSGGTVQGTTTATTATSATVWADLSPTWGGSAYVSWLEVDGNDLVNNTVYATNSRFGGGVSHVMRSTDGGTTWTDITNNLPDIATHCIVVQPGFSSNLFVGTDLGIFVSTDTGATWASMNTPDFANVVVESMEFQDASSLYLFTHGRGAWRATVDTQPPESNIVVSPLSLSFGEQRVDAGPTGAQTITITNDGNINLNISGVALGGTDPGEFTIASDTGEAVLAPSASRTLQVTFDPTSLGAKSATITITSDDPDEPSVVVNLGGTGVMPEITVAPLALAFGSQGTAAGATASQAVTITNDGTSTLTISSVGLTGTDPGEFAIASDTGEGTLAPAASRIVQVAFDPGGLGAKSATLRIVSDDADESTVDVTLDGTGIDIVFVDAANTGVEDGS